MEKKTKKTAKPAKSNSETKKNVSKKTTSTPKKSTSAKVVEGNEVLKSKITRLETAYLAALSGKMKFGQVKSLFKKMHKEIKESNKK